MVLIPGSGRSPEEEMQLSPIFLPEKSQGQKSLVGCSPKGCKESDKTEQLRILYPLRQQEKGMAVDEMTEWHHQIGGHEFEQAPGIGDGQRSLACCSPWGCKELGHN